jgi:hypothetical protein
MFHHIFHIRWIAVGMGVGESLLTNSDSTLDKAKSGITAVRSKVPRSQAFLDIQC